MDQDVETNPIRTSRKRRGWGLNAFARHVGIAPSTLWRIESGREWPRARTVVALCGPLHSDPAKCYWRMRNWKYGGDPDCTFGITIPCGSLVHLKWELIPRTFVEDVMSLVRLATRDLDVLPRVMGSAVITAMISSALED